MDQSSLELRPAVNGPGSVHNPPKGGRDEQFIPRMDTENRELTSCMVSEPGSRGGRTEPDPFMVGRWWRVDLLFRSRTTPEVETIGLSDEIPAGL